MGLRANFTELNTKDPVLQRMFNSISKSISSLARAVPQDFDQIKTFKDQVLDSTTPLTIKHGLGRAPRGWIVAGLTQISGTPGVVYEASSAYPDNDQAVVLRLTIASGICRATVYVY